MKKIFVILITLILIFSVTGCGSELFEADILITTHTSPDGDYTVSLYQVGSPGWSFGSVGAKLVLENKDEKAIDEVSFALNNDGGNVWEGNIEEITWLEDEVEILMNESDTTQMYTYVLKYDK